MKVIQEGVKTDDALAKEVASAGTCTQEPGDNCWMQLD